MKIGNHEEVKQLLSSDMVSEDNDVSIFIIERILYLEK